LALSFFKIRLKPDYRIEIEMTTDNFLWVGPSHSIGNNGDVRAERAQFQKQPFISQDAPDPLKTAGIVLIGMLRV